MGVILPGAGTKNVVKLRSKEVKMEIKDLKFDDRNYRIHTEKNKELIKRSLDNYGIGRSIVVDNDNCIIGGNGVVSQLDSDTPIRVIETTGDELVVVKRTDLSTNDPKRQGLALMENTTSDSGEMDIELAQEDFTKEELGFMGVDLMEIDVDGELKKEDNKIYTQKITPPIYEIKGEEPKLNELLSKDKADKYIKEIENSGLSEDKKQFLKDCATRLIEFDYSKIAEYYCHQDKEMQDLMEKLALIIIDYNKAVENGYVAMSEKINELVGVENEEE
jgi:hypothetical protein